MIRLSNEARAFVRRLLAGEGTPDGGVRITAAEEDDGIACEVQLADQPVPGDTVLEQDGVRLFLDSVAADALDDAELVVEDGELALALPEAAEAAGCGAT